MEHKNNRPNIILILADDLGYSDIGCFGSEIKTPNIDSIAEKGVKFTQMYNSARCCPSRASLLTGLYPHQAGVGHMTSNLGFPGYLGYLNDQCVTIAEGLKYNGYKTMMSGKWHIGGPYDPRHPENWKPGNIGFPDPVNRGFDQFYGTLAGCASYYNPHTLMRNDKIIDIETDDYYYTDAITDNAISMIHDNAKQEEPFFLYLAYTAPHWPLHAKSEDIAKYEGMYRKGWDRLRKDRYDKMVDQKIIDDKWKLSPRDEESYPWEDVKEKDWEDMRMAVYAAQVDNMDQGIGRVMDSLNELDIADNTLIMFMSDNGGCAEFLAEDGFVQNVLYPKRDGTEVRAGNFSNVMPGDEDTYMSYDLPWANVSNSPFRLFKHWVHEGGISTPFVMKWPEKIKKPNTVNSPTHFIDIMTTCIAAAGGNYPAEYNGHVIQPMEGEDLIPAAVSNNWKRDVPIFWEHEGNAAVRDGKWKMVKKFPGKWELYNMEQDRTEGTDLAEKDKSRVEEYSKMYAAWADRCNVIPVEKLVKIAPKEDYPTFEEC